MLNRWIKILNMCQGTKWIGMLTVVSVFCSVGEKLYRATGALSNEKERWSHSGHRLQEDDSSDEMSTTKAASSDYCCWTRLPELEMRRSARGDSREKYEWWFKLVGRSSISITCFSVLPWMAGKRIGDFPDKSLRAVFSAAQTTRKWFAVLRRPSWCWTWATVKCRTGKWLDASPSKSPSAKCGAAAWRCESPPWLRAGFDVRNVRRRVGFGRARPPGHRALLLFDKLYR